MGTTAALAALALGSFLPAAASAGSSQWSIFEDHPYLVRTDGARRERTLDEIRQLGADTLRVEVKWDEVAPNPASRTRPQFDATNPAEYPGFGPFDDLVKTATARTLRIVVTITGDAPRWATSGDRGGNYKPDPVEYGRFVTAVAKRYSGVFSDVPKVTVFTIWNEPNHIQFIKPTSQAPRTYRRLVDAAIPALRANAAPEAKILIGELKPTPRKGLGPATFLQGWLCLDKEFRRLRGRAARRNGCSSFKKIDADGFAHHPYGPIEIVSKKRDIINLLAIRRLGKALDLAAKAKRVPRGLPIYNTEFGIQSNPPDIFVATSPSRQAALINEKEEFAYRYPRLKSHSQYQLYDDPARPGPPAVKWSGFQTGLKFSNGREKPAYDAYRFPIVVRKSKAGKVVIWGRVRTGTGARSIQLQRKSGSGFANVGARIATNSLGYFLVKKNAGNYRFQAYGHQSDGTGGATGSAITLLGTSRTATPKLLPSR
jgi:cellulase (glycosyl hydrolase family 5)